MASRKEQKEALRRERHEREQREAQAAARKRMIGIAVAAILALGIVVALAVVVFAGDDDNGGSSGSDKSDGGAAKVSYPDGGEIPTQQEADFAKALEASGCEEDVLRDVAGSGEHTTDDVTYESEPPAIGPHFPEWPEDALFEEAPPLTRVVHTLEHGRILIWVKPDAPDDLLAQVKAFYDEDPYHVIVLPRAEIKEPIAASAWVGQDTGHILRCAEPNDRMWDALRAFKEKYRDRAPEFVP